MIFFYTFLAFVGLLQPRHDFHNSITEVNFNSRSKSLEVVMRVFTDDLERAIAKDSRKANFRFSTSSSKDDILLRRYVLKRFYLMNKKGQLKQSYIGKKHKSDKTIIFIEIPYRKSPHGLKVRNAVLTDIFYDQKNIVNIFYKDQKNTLLCMRGSEVKTIDLED